MESRPTEDQTYVAEPVDALAELPEEMQLHIFSFFQKTGDLARVQQLNHHNYRIVNTNSFWITKYKKQHGAIPFLSNAKNQFLAANLHAQSLDLRIDEQQIRLKNSARFIQQFQAESWTFYYQGIATFFGRGRKKDPEAGFKLLMKGFAAGDHRTAFAMACILLDTKISEPETFNNLLVTLGKEGLHRLITRLFDIHNKKILVMNYLIGRLFVYGLGVERSFSRAEPFFLAVIPLTESGLSDLAFFKLESYSAPERYEKNVLETIAYIKEMSEKYKIIPTQNLINYYTAYLELFRENRAESARLLLLAPKFIPAKIALSHLYEEQGQLDAAAEQLVDVINMDDTSVAGYLFDLLARLEPLDEAIKLIRAAAPKRLADIAPKVSAKYREHFISDEWCHDAVIVWWLQFAAQCGCQASLDTLLSVDAKKYPYICCALGIIYEFGIMNSDTIEPNHDKAEYYFHLTSKVNALDIETYILLGIGEGLACQEVIDLVHNHSAHNNQVATSFAK